MNQSQFAIFRVGHDPANTELRYSTIPKET